MNLHGFDPTDSPTPPQTAASAFLDVLAVEPATVPADSDAQAAPHRSLVAGRHMLIVLANARDTARATPLPPGSSS